MKIFLAGATGVIGVRLVPLLVDAGHEVVGMTRSAAKVDASRTPKQGTTTTQPAPAQTPAASPAGRTSGG